MFRSKSNLITAEDALPLSPNPVPSTLEGLIVKGERSGRVRSVPFDIPLPQKPSTASFFDQQSAPAKPLEYNF